MAGVLTVACGLGDKEARARIIEAMPAEAAQAGVASGTVGVGVAAELERPGSDRAEQLAALGSGEEVFSLGFVADVERRVGAYTIGPQPLVLHDDLVVYGRRYDVAPNEARPWVRYDLGRLDESSARVNPMQDGPVLGIELVSPIALLELTSGALTGSIEEVERTELNGVPVVHYEANFDFEKVYIDTRRDAYSEERRDALLAVMDVAAISEEVHPGELWVDDEGRLRRFVVHLKRSRPRFVKLELVLSVDVTNYGESPIDLTPPGVDELLDVDGALRMLRAVEPPIFGAPGGGRPQLPEGVEVPEGFDPSQLGQVTG